MKSTVHKTTLTPKLRFPEFRNGPGWEEKTLGELASISTERVGTLKCIPMSITSGIGLVSQQEKFGRTIAGSQFKNYLLLQKGDFAYNKSSTKDFPQGYIAMYSGEELAAVPNSIFTCFRINGGSPIREYLKYMFLGNLHGRWLRKFITIGARAHGSLNIADDDILSIPIPLPAGKTSLAEQQKLAACLTSLDELIGAESQKLDALKLHKKGLMEQLFPREGETVPRLRFPKFQDAAEWVEKTVDNFGEVVTGSTPKTAHPEFYGGGIPFVSPADISDLRFVDETKTTLTTLGFNETRPIPVNSVMFVCIGSTIGKVAKNRQYCATNQQINTVIPNSEHSAGFVYYILSQNAERIARLAGKQAVPIINKTLFSSVLMSAPTLVEQQCISACLSSLDDLIAAQAQKLDALKLHKKGLMQKLFPSATEVEP